LVADAAAAERAKQEGRPRGPVIGLQAVDADLGGYLAPGVHLLQAAPGAGKSAFCLQAAARCGCPALVVSTEMSVLEMFRRLIAQMTGVYLGRLKSGELTVAAVEELARRTASLVPQVAFMDGTGGFASPSFIREAVDALRARFGSEDALIVLDSLHVWARGAQGGASEYETITAACGSLHTLAQQIRCPVLAVAHRNRAGQREGGLHAGKGSGELEYAGESVMELQPGEITGNPEREVALWIHKNRNGTANVMVELSFEGRCQRFREAGYASRPR
jgi:replicative DNA helicase